MLSVFLNHNLPYFSEIRSLIAPGLTNLTRLSWLVRRPRTPSTCFHFPSTRLQVNAWLLKTCMLGLQLGYTPSIVQTHDFLHSP